MTYLVKGGQSLKQFFKLNSSAGFGLTVGPTEPWLCQALENNLSSNNAHRIS